MPTVTALRPTEVFAAKEWQTLTRVSRWHGLWLVGHAWGSVVLIIAATLWVGHWLAWLPAIFLIGGRQLGLAILMHEAAHGLLHPNRRLNNWLGDWATGASVGSDLQSYRRYHLTHHRYTQQPEDPDLPLSAPFPTSSASLWRKVARDLFGQTFFKQRRVQFGMARRGMQLILAGASGSRTASDTVAGSAFNRQGVGAVSGSDASAIAVFHAVSRFVIVQIVLLALSLTLYGWTPFLLWSAALATTFQLALRIRNIAEHACTAIGPGDPFSHARTTRASMIERALVAPYWVNFHAEHHLFMGVPCYRLERAHYALLERGFGPRMAIADSYAMVMRQVVARQP